MGVKRGYRQSSEHVAKRIAAMVATARARPRPVSADWLHQRYWVERASCVDIGRELGKDPKTILEWMRHYGIPTRPRGAASSPGAFAPGHVSPFTGHKHTDKARALFRELRIADGRVPYLKNGEHWLRSVPRSAHPNWKGGISPERQDLYASAGWKEAVKVVWARAGARCERCDTHHNTTERRGTFHIHHIIGFAVRELRAEPSNLALLCADCHRFVHSRANVDREFLEESPHGRA